MRSGLKRSLSVGPKALMAGALLLNSCTIPARGEPRTTVSVKHETVRQDFKPVDEKPLLSRTWEHGTCSLQDGNIIVYTKDDQRKELQVSVPMVAGPEKPLDMTCSDKRTTLLTDRKATILPGFSAFEGELDIVLSHSLSGISDLGILSWSIQSSDNLFLITGDNRFWYTSLNDSEDILGYRLGELKAGGPKGMFYYRKIVFIAQNADPGEPYLVAVRLISGERNLGVRSFLYPEEEKGRIEFSEKEGHLQLRIGESIHSISVGKEGDSESISVR